MLGQTQGAYELLAEAQEQQNETGYLELDTVVKLLEEYPQLSGYLVEASNGYLLPAEPSRIISTQRAEYALALNEAQSAADAIVTAEADKINAINATTLATKDQLTALAELYQSMGANADNLAEGVSYYAKANEYREAAQALADARENPWRTMTASRPACSARAPGPGAADGPPEVPSSKKTEAAKDEGTSAMEELQEWLDDVDHRIFLWSKDEAKTQAIVDLYQTMMDRVHELAEGIPGPGLRGKLR